MLKSIHDSNFGDCKIVEQAWPKASLDLMCFKTLEIGANLISGGLSLSLADALIFKGILLI